MAVRRLPFPPCPFGAHDYQISCLPTDAPRWVDIGAQAARPLQVGDHYTIDRDDNVCDLVVEEVSHSPGGGWSARCRVSDPRWP
jgi:hypothetical protein